MAKRRKISRKKKLLAAGAGIAAGAAFLKSKRGRRLIRKGASKVGRIHVGGGTIKTHVKKALKRSLRPAGMLLKKGLKFA